MNKKRTPLPNALTEGHKSPMELFQNTTLRPVLKMQHEWVVQLIEYHLEQANPQYKTLVLAKKEVFATQFIQSHTGLKHLIIGGIVGHFSQNELAEYLIHPKEYNKRIIQMTLQRYVSTF